MKSRRYTIFEIGSTGELFGEYQTIVGPVKEDLVCSAFMGFFMERLNKERGYYAVFAAPIALEDNVLAAAQGLLTIKYWTTAAEPRFNKERILRRLFPEFDDVWEVFNGDKINFERMYPVKRIKLNNTTEAWTF